MKKTQKQKNENENENEIGYGIDRFVSTHFFSKSYTWLTSPNKYMAKSRWTWKSAPFDIILKPILGTFEFANFWKPVPNVFRADGCTHGRRHRHIWSPVPRLHRRFTILKYIEFCTQSSRPRGIWQRRWLAPHVLLPPSTISNDKHEICRKGPFCPLQFSLSPQTLAHVCLCFLCL